MENLNLNLKYKGQTGAKTTKEYLEMTEKKINEIVGWDMPKEFLNSSKMQKIEDVTNDVDDVREPGLYYSLISNSGGVIANYPKKSSSSVMMVIKVGSTIMQVVIPSSGIEVYIRRFLSNAWQNWYKYEGSVVTF